MSPLHSFTTNLQKYSCQSLSFSLGHNVLVSLGLNFLIVLTTEIKPQNIFPGFIYSVKKESIQGLDISGFTSTKTCMKARTVYTCITKDSRLNFLPSSPCISFSLCCLTVWDPFHQPSLPERPTDTLQHPHVYLSWPQSASLWCQS